MHAQLGNARNVPVFIIKKAHFMIRDTRLLVQSFQVRGLVIVTINVHTIPKALLESRAVLDDKVL